MGNRTGRKPALVICLLIGLATLAAAACSQGESEVNIQLVGQDGSTQSGTAKLTANGPRTEVVLAVSPGPPANDPQPVHIHFGTCGPNLGKVQYPLSDVVAGKSSTVVDATLDSLVDGNSNINLHKSYPDVSIYTACGNVPKR